MEKPVQAEEAFQRRTLDLRGIFSEISSEKTYTLIYYNTDPVKLQGGF